MIMTTTAPAVIMKSKCIAIKVQLMTFLSSFIPLLQNHPIRALYISYSVLIGYFSSMSTKIVLKKARCQVHKNVEHMTLSNTLFVLIGQFI